jgi:hypothetical protein
VLIYRAGERLFKLCLFWVKKILSCSELPMYFYQQRQIALRFLWKQLSADKLTFTVRKALVVPAQIAFEYFLVDLIIIHGPEQADAV